MKVTKLKISPKSAFSPWNQPCVQLKNKLKQGLFPMHGLYASLSNFQIKLMKDGIPLTPLEEILWLESVNVKVFSFNKE